MSKKEDRRILKTKKYLSQAFLDLILEKGYENVTVQDILDRSETGRATFYNHYKNKEELFLAGPKNLKITFFEKQEEEIKVDYKILCNHVFQNKKLAKGMLGKRGGIVMFNFIKKRIIKDLKKKYSNQYNHSQSEKKQFEYLNEVAGTAVISLILAWVEDDCYFPSSEIAKKCNKIIEGILTSGITG